MKTELTKSEFWRIEGVEWREVRLGEIFEIVRGGSPRPIKHYLTAAKDGINWIKISDAKEGCKYITRTKEKIIKEGVKKSRKVYPGDLLLTNSMTVGKAYISKIEGCIHDGWLLLHYRSNDLYHEYFYYLLNSHVLKHKLSKKARGGVVRNLNTTLVKSTLIPLPFCNGKPDLETQKKIVEYIESNFSRIDSILEKKKKILSQLDELWESTLKNAFKPREGEEWRAVKLGEIIIDKPRYGLTAKSKNKGKYLYLRITDINDKGEINEDGFKFVDLDKKEKSKYEIKKGDLLLARSGSVGNFFIADKDYPDWVYASYLIRFRLDSNKILPSFIKHVLISRKFKRWVEYQKRTGAQPNINAKEYSSFKFPLPFHNGKPDLERQKEIADYLDGVYEKIKSIKEKVKSQISQLDEMKESILNEVFSHDKVK